MIRVHEDMRNKYCEEMISLEKIFECEIEKLMEKIPQHNLCRSKILMPYSCSFKFIMNLFILVDFYLLFLKQTFWFIDHWNVHCQSILSENNITIYTEINYSDKYENEFEINKDLLNSEITYHSIHMILTKSV